MMLRASYHCILVTLLIVIILCSQSLSFSHKNILKLGRKEQIEFVQGKVSLSSIIGRFTELTQSSPDTYRCLCPFHDDHNPSMLINEGPGYYYCFSCGATGTAINYVAHQKNITFPNALNKLVTLSSSEDELHRWLDEGMMGAIPPTNNKPIRIKTTKLMKSIADSESKVVLDVATVERIRQVLRQAQRYYTARLLMDPAAHSVRQYLQSRKISPATAVAFRLGYSPPAHPFQRQMGGAKAPQRAVAGVSVREWKVMRNASSLAQWLSRCETLTANHTVSDILAAVNITGLVKRSTPTTLTGITSPDRFQGRLIIPILAATGNVIGFAGRILPTEYSSGISGTGMDVGKKVCKYVNSPNCPGVFEKKQVLFGEAQARQGAGTQGTVLVEGYFDVFALHELGVKNVVASMGTALSIQQLLRAAQLSESGKVVILFDGDAAGDAAVARAIQLLYRHAEMAKSEQLPPTSVGSAVSVSLYRASIADANAFLRNHSMLSAEALPVKDCGDICERFARKDAQRVVASMLRSAKLMDTVQLPLPLSGK